MIVPEKPQIIPFECYWSFTACCFIIYVLIALDEEICVLVSVGWIREYGLVADDVVLDDLLVIGPKWPKRLAGAARKCTYRKYLAYLLCFIKKK
jgi:hypothetical protein